MTVTLASLSFDADDPPALAGFWATALRWEVSGTVIAPGGDGDPTSFRIEFVPASAPKVGQNRIHFDLTTASPPDQAGSVAELLAAGARHIDIGQDPGDTHVVLADPEGNELCVIEPQNRFLASCPRLGAVNCDGTHALGEFWSRALGWPLVWDEGEETAVQAPGGIGPKITWSGPPLMPAPARERMHFHVVSEAGDALDDTIDALCELGATRSAVAACPGAVGLADVDGNAFCLLPA